MLTSLIDIAQRQAPDAQLKHDSNTIGIARWSNMPRLK